MIKTASKLDKRVIHCSVRKYKEMKVLTKAAFWTRWARQGDNLEGRTPRIVHRLLWKNKEEKMSNFLGESLSGGPACQLSSLNKQK